MKISKKDESLLAKVRLAVEFYNEGTPIKDEIDDDEICEALELLVKIDDALKKGGLITRIAPSHSTTK